MLLRILGRIEKKLNQMRMKAAFGKVNCNLDRIVLGADCDRDFNIWFPEKLSVGDGTVINGYCYINAFGGVSIGRYCHIGKGLTIFSHNHNWKSEESLPYDKENIIKPVAIGDAVWIGANVTIAPGCTIGDGVIISSGAVVFGHISEGSIIRGNPAVEIGRRDEALFRKLRDEQRFF